MSERSFESQLASLYRQAPPSPDDRAFLAQVDAELTRHVRRRRLLLAALGAVGGAVSVTAILRLEAAAGMRDLLRSAFHVVASVELGVATTAVLIASLALPVLMRALIDPK